MGGIRQKDGQAAEILRISGLCSLSIIILAKKVSTNIDNIMVTLVLLILGAFFFAACAATGIASVNAKAMMITVVIDFLMMFFIINLLSLVYDKLSLL